MKGHPSELQLEKALIATKTQYHQKKKKKKKVLQCYDYPKPDKNRMTDIIFVSKMFFLNWKMSTLLVVEKTKY